MILIDETKLELLLEQKKEYIGTRVALDSVLSAISFLVSVGLASYPNILGVTGNVLKIFFMVVGIGFTIKSIYDVVYSKRNEYTKEDLFTDIESLNQITHNHSIVAIKDTFNDHPNRYLVYYDSRWNCNLFPNFKENINNEDFIINGIRNALKIDDVSVQFITQRIHEKYSESHEEMRLYQHRLYICTIGQFTDRLKNDEFEIDGIKYFWKTIQEMENDGRTDSVNRDILEWVKENCS